MSGLLEEDEKLINQVRLYRPVYDSAHCDYRDQAKVDESWASIAAATGKDVEYCRRRWDRLKKEFIYERKSRASPPGLVSSRRKTPWPLYENTRWLSDHILERNCRRARHLALSQEQDGHRLVDAAPAQETEDDLAISRAFCEVPAANYHKAMFPLRVVIETVKEGECTRCTDAGPLMADSYAIVSGQTPLCQLVDTVLNALGLQQFAHGAKGMIQLNNWKPLPFNVITDDTEATVEYLLKDVSNHLTLKILTKQTDTAVQDCVVDMKERLLKATVKRNPHILSTIKNHQLKDFVTQLLQDAPPLNVSAEQMHGFNHWLDELSGGGGGGAMFASPVTPSNGSPNGGGGRSPGSGAGRFFSVSLEMPKLERWFTENQNPTRQKLLQYMTILNAGNYRRHHSKITYQQICNWFSNARAVVRHAAAASEEKAISSSVGGNTPAMNGGGGGGFDINELLRRRQQMAAAAAAAMAAAMNGMMTANNNASSSAAIGVTNGADQMDNSGGGDTNGGGSVDNDCLSALTAGGGVGAADGGVASSPPSTAMHDDGGGVDGGGVKNELQDSTSMDDNNQLRMDDDEDDEDEEALSKSSPDSSSSPGGAKNAAAFDAANAVFDPNATGGGLSVDTSAAVVATISSLVAASQQQLNGGSAFSPKLQDQNGGGDRASTTPTNNNNISGMMSRSRLMFDPLTELPLLEKWFEENPHPSWIQIDQYTETLNSLSYRQTYPPISTHNVKIWFKNRRAKCKRMLGIAIDKFHSGKTEVR